MKTEIFRKKAPKEKENCFVCGKYKTITEYHHVIPLNTCVKLLEYVEEIEIPMLWLCPNHHTMAHHFFDDFYKKNKPYDIVEISWN